MLSFRFGIALLGIVTLPGGCAPTTESCVRRRVDTLFSGESRLQCTGKLRVRRTGKPCGSNHEAVILENCSWERYSDGKTTLEGPVVVYMPIDRSVCDVREQAGGLCFE
jgi:hypothetical protein